MISQTLGVLRCGVIGRLGLVMLYWNRRLLAIESALDGWVRVMMRQSVAVADVRRLTVRVLAHGMRQLAFVSMAI
ncbi:MAG: hypothetical protein WBE69_00740 [Candidatus Binataceae bacterium]